MTRDQWKQFYRIYRIMRVMAEELSVDTLIYGTSFQLRNEFGIFNVPPEEVSMKDGEVFIKGWSDAQ